MNELTPINLKNPKNDSLKVSIQSSKILLIAFIEGAAVMACELLGAKMIAPFFGTTIYSWASILAITLGGLASGYYVGGWLTSKYNPIKLLKIILYSSSVLMLLMPIWSSIVMKLFIETDLILGLISSLMLFLFPPIFFFGMVSPVIIHALVNSLNDTGKMAGKVYAISTLGGVLNTLLIGFYLLPEFGIFIPSLLNGALLLFAAIVLLPSSKKIVLSIAGIFSVFMVGQNYKAMSNAKPYSQFQVITHSEGMMGQIKVVDYSIKMDSIGIIPVRGLLVNNTWQTVINLNDGTALLDYIYFIRPLLSEYKPGKKALLIGLGGGTLCREMQQKGLDVEVVEIEDRLKYLAIQYFGLSPQTLINIDDGRHFLNKCKTKYDLIVFDAFLGENPPWHLLTKESFEKVQKLLLPGGRLIIEFYGYGRGKYGIVGRSLRQTLISSGFRSTQIIATSFTDGIERNFIYVAGSEAMNLTNLDYSGIIYSDKRITNLNDYLLPESFWKGKAIVFTDNLPSLETMLAQPSIEWRKELNELYRNRMVEQKLPIFY